MSIQSSEGILFDKIGGWLIFPAILHPIVSIFYNGSGLVEAFDMLKPALPVDAQVYIWALVAAYIGLCAAWAAALYYALRIDPIFPTLYIGVVATDLIVGLAVAGVAIWFYGATPTAKDAGEFTRGIISACIWIPYMLVSKRVKATFYDVPMPSKLAFENVTSPLKQAALERQQVRSDIHQDREPLNMVQRIGMVLYWAGTGLAIIMTLLALIGFANGPDKSFAIVMLVAAALSWLIGRALKYIFVGR